jgi:hypothetical protein
METLLGGIEQFLERLKDYVEKIIHNKCSCDTEVFGRLVTQHRQIGDQLCNFWDDNYKEFLIDDAQNLHYIITTMSAIVPRLDAFYLRYTNVEYDRSVYFASLSCVNSVNLCAGSSVHVCL